MIEIVEKEEILDLKKRVAALCRYMKVQQRVIVTTFGVEYACFDTTKEGESASGWPDDKTE